MFAVVKIAGQQYKVQKDQTLYVPHVGGNAGDKIEISDIVLVDSDGTISLSDAINVKVQAEVLNHIQGDKVIAYKQKRRKGFRKKHGHRTLYTQLKISDIA